MVNEMIMSIFWDNTNELYDFPMPHQKSLSEYGMN